MATIEGVVISRSDDAPSQPLQTPAPLRPPSPLYSFVDRLVLAVPNAHRPGLLAVVVFVARQVALSRVCTLALIGICMMLVPPGTHFNEQAALHSPYARVILFGPLVVFEELGRYAFVRRAERPARALAIFTAATVAILLLTFHNDLYALSWTISATVIASIALYFALEDRRHLGAVVCLVMAAHVGVYEAAPIFDPPAEASAAVN